MCRKRWTTKEMLCVFSVVVALLNVGSMKKGVQMERVVSVNYSKVPLDTSHVKEMICPGVGRICTGCTQNLPATNNCVIKQLGMYIFS